MVNGTGFHRRSGNSIRDGLHACRRYMHYTLIARAPFPVHSREHWLRHLHDSIKVISICVAICSPAGQRLPHGLAAGSEVIGVIFVMRPKKPRTCLPLGAETSSHHHRSSCNPCRSCTGSSSTPTWTVAPRRSKFASCRAQHCRSHFVLQWKCHGRCSPDHQNATPSDSR